jgi:hypothetical protein
MTQPTPHGSACAQDGDIADADRELLQQTLARRFRHTLHTGQVSPLLHLMLRYRLEVRPCTAPS